MSHWSRPEVFADIRFAGDVRPERGGAVPWLWPGRIPLGKLTLLVGDPGVGKSLLAADLAARVSAGLAWPDEAAGDLGRGAAGDSDSGTAGEGSCGAAVDEVDRAAVDAVRGAAVDDGSEAESADCYVARHMGGVVMVSAEDRLDDALYGRLRAAGAKLDLICVLEGVTDRLPSALGPGRSVGASYSPFSLCLHMDVLEQAVRAVNCPRLVILDPLVSLMAPPAAFAGAHPRWGGDVSDWGTPDRLVSVLNGLADMARRKGVAIVGITHCAKHGDRSIYRARGSIAFVAAARSVLFLTRAAGEADGRVLSAVKTVYAGATEALRFRIVSGEGGPKLVWAAGGGDEGGCTEAGALGGAEALCGAAEELVGLSDEAQSALSEACAWLTDALASGEKAARQLLADARGDGISRRTLQRAKRILGVRSERSGEGWVWVGERDEGT